MGTSTESADPDPAFEAALRRAGLQVRVERVPTYPGAKTRHTILLASGT